MTSENISIVSKGFNVSKEGKVDIIAEDDMAIDSAILTVRNESDTSYSKVFPSLFWSENQYGLARLGTFGWPLLYLKNHQNGYGITAQIRNNNKPEMKFSGLNETAITSDEITTPTLTQTSKESKKKNISKYNEKALDIVKDSTIYEFNFKSEDDNHKKHIGFVIGDEGGKYKTPEQVISNDREGIESYSMTSILWKAFQEYIVEKDEQIKQLQNEINELKKESE